ncbi:hypothetical protein J8281_15010 [Aquimarina sp. U1-2]|uniref:hypothetical protein n=1 Tax=Aquimarina sp. U1-2 TaxID=2823141 RepID=UPI001AEC9AAC|nr:hypothetical protein [Aquimarina sp. U1-2]MBP2833503.1 hypothetical protein [Aquimarina sp. U1-2]
MATIKPQENQTIFDIALQEYGGVEGIFSLLDDNGFYQVDRELSVYEDLRINSSPTRRDIKAFYVSRNILPANGISKEDLTLLDVQDRPDGIGYMTVEDDFIVHSSIDPK